MAVVISILGGLIASYLGVALLKAYNTVELQKKKYGNKGRASGADRRQTISFFLGNALVILGLVLFYNAFSRKFF
jgi:hypothetical protein